MGGGADVGVDVSVMGSGSRLHLVVFVILHIFIFFDFFLYFLVHRNLLFFVFCPLFFYFFILVETSGNFLRDWVRLGLFVY